MIPPLALLLALAPLLPSPPNAFPTAPYVTCPDASGPNLYPAHARSPVVETRDHSHRAYAINEARFTTQRGCFSTARLYVSTNLRPYRLAYTMQSETDHEAISFVPVAWSPDQKWLALETLETSHLGGDAGGFGVLLYHAPSRHAHVVDSDLSPTVSARLSRKCSIDLLRIDGFHPSGSLILRLTDTSDEEGKPESTCVAGHEQWLLDPATHALAPAH